ncbi:ROK family transcriptional regulator [Cytobacillus oceanisediminis]
MPPAAPDQLRRANTALVVRTLRDAGPSSRTSLARRTGLAKATVGAIVGELSERSVVVEGDASSQGRGRPSRPVELAAGSVLGLGLEVNVDYVAAALVDLAATQVLTTTRQVPDGADALETLVELALEVADQAPGRIVGAHLAVPGLVERDHATVALAPNLGWTGTRPGDVLAEALGVTVLVDNDANLAAVAESTHGAAQQSVSTLYITGTVGIGAGIVQDGRLVRGSGFAGEVGHMPIGDLGRRCACGRQGCWETTVGLRAALAAVGMRASGTPMERAAKVAARAETDADVATALDVLGAQLGHGLATLCTVLDPEVIVLGGYFQPLAPWILRSAQDVVHRRLPAAHHQRPDVRVGTLGIEAAALGAAEQALTDVLEGSVAL